MKAVKNLYFTFLIFVIVTLCFGCKSMENRFKDLDVYNATGDKIIGLWVKGNEFTDKFIPSDLCAKNTDEVGCLLLLDSHYSTNQYRSLDGQYAERKYEVISAKLIDLHTNLIVAEEHFIADQPKTTTHSGTDVVDEEIVTSWLLNVYKAPKVSEKVATVKKNPPKTMRRFRL